MEPVERHRQTFGALGTVVSTFALFAFIITFLSQVRELRTQHAELALQTKTFRNSQAELYRNTAVGLRGLHLDLLRMAIDDEQLAAVWPPFQSALFPEINRQYLYANLIFQHHWLCLHMSDYIEEQIDITLPLHESGNESVLEVGSYRTRLPISRF